MAAKRHLSRSILALLPLLIGLVFFFAASSNLNLPKKTKFDEVALGKETQGYRATYQGVLVHCDILDDGTECIQGWERRGQRPVTLWLGNSQLHAINQMQGGDVTGVQLLHDAVTTTGNDLIAFSEPNANLQEHYLLFAYLQERLPIKTLLMPAVFDDTRESGVRSGLLPALSDIETSSALGKTEIGRQILSENEPAQADGDLAGLNKTTQRVVEAAITNWLTEHWSLWEARPKMRGSLFTSLYRWRNAAFGINPQSKRKMIPVRYNKNLAALDAVLDSCAENGINVILYIAPLRNDVEAPYVAKEYAGFKRDVEAMAAKYDVVYADLEDLVPANLWRRKDATSLSGEAELDFMHFQAGGHRLLAKAMFDLLDQNGFLE